MTSTPVSRWILNQARKLYFSAHHVKSKMNSTSVSNQKSVSDKSYLNVIYFSQHALQELKHIAEERARTEREAGTLALIVKGGMTKEDSERYKNMIE